MCQIKTKGTLIILLIISFFVSGSVCGQTNPEKEGYQLPPVAENALGLFDRNDILEISLRYDIGYYMQEKPEEAYMEALMTIYFSPQDSLNKNIRLRARGNYRYRNCLFPPIRLNFKNSNFGYDDLDKQENIKIVTHCDTSEIFEKYMLREFLVYKMMNTISDYSFRVRLLKVNYIDISNSSPGFTKYAFAIEPLKELIKRKGGTELENVELVYKDMLTRQIEKM
ncbi:MAG: hypothetical protein QNK33_01030, partial [Bacteroidales bacterium]|nr:hypothetical protein [Bacteroidales bacterium]